VVLEQQRLQGEYHLLQWGLGLRRQVAGEVRGFRQDKLHGSNFEPCLLWVTSGHHSVS
jgi:hypothetical protein